MKKGQVAIEFMTYIGIAILLTTMSLMIILDYYKDYSLDQKELELETFGKNLQREIGLASAVSPGYQRDIEIPDEITTVSFNISNGNNYFQLEYSRGALYYRIPRINGTLSKGTNTLRNIGGEVYVS